jgi:choice-of-anchor B domain-containing protein
MVRLQPSVLSTAVLIAGLGLPLSAHEDDPKLLDRQPAHPGEGIRTGVPAPGARLGGTKAAGFAANKVTLLSWLTLGDLSAAATSGNDCWGYTSPSGREYALMGVSSGTAFVEITDPNAPEIVAFHSGPSSLWRDIKVFGTHVYSVSEGGSGIQVFNVANIDAGTVANLGTVTTGGDTATHNVAIDTVSGYLYRTGGGNNGLRMYNLNANPAVPALVGTWSNKYVHDAQVITYTSGPLAGKQIAYCCSGFNGGFDNTGLSIVDVTNKNAPVVLDEVFWPGAQYSHQVWLSPDLQLAYLNDELDENGIKTTTTYVINVADPSNAFLVGSFTNGNQAVGHNNYTTADRLFAANYRSGLRIFDLGANPTNPPEEAWFDTYPEDDDDAFNGLWSVYPYFESGVVIGSDLERGLFVWWVGDALLDIEPVGGGLALIDPSGDALALTIDELAPGTLVPGTTKLHYDAGAGVVTTDLVSLGGNLWSANFPALTCGSALSYFVSAQSTNGITWSWPEGGSSAPQQAIVATGMTLVVEDTLEINSGWTVGTTGDNASSGVWTRVNPVGSAAQPEDDHTLAPGTFCFVTGQGVAGGGVGDNDVDNGTTTLVSPAYDLSALGEPYIGYWRWYSNNQNGVVDDSFVVQVSNGGAWTTVETVGPAGVEAGGGWYHHQFRVADFVPPTAAVRVRFRAADLGSGSIVEAGVDDLRVEDLLCAPAGGPITYCTAKLSSSLCLPSIGFSGSPSFSSPSGFSITTTGMEAATTAIDFFGTTGQANVPFQGGLICAASPIYRLGGKVTGGAGACTGSISYTLQDVMNHSAGGALVVVGGLVNIQSWGRDLSDPFGSSLSNALEIVVQP